MWVTIPSVVEEMRNVFTFVSPGKLVFGVNAVTTLGDEAQLLKASRVLIVTDKGVEKAGLVEKVKSPLEEKKMSVQVFDAVEPEPSLKCAEASAAIARGGKFDLIVGVGGGSSMDMAKVAAAMVTNPGSVSQYLGSYLLVNPTLPKILIPTTAGTGSEISTGAIVTDESHTKRWIIDTKNFANVSLVDPMMTISLPPRQTAHTGLDALTHAIEAVMSIVKNPISDCLAYYAVRLIAKNLKTAYYQGSNLEARYKMCLGATLAVLAQMNAGGSLAHSVSYVLHSHYGTTHGEGCAVALPYVMDYNLVTCEDMFRRVAEEMGIDVADLSNREAAIRAIEAVYTLLKDLDVPYCLREMKVSRTALETLAEECQTKYPRPNTPRRVERQTLMNMWERMWEGRITEY
jgi:alcohol dehydrogenase